VREQEVSNFYFLPTKDNPLLKEFPVKYVLLDNQTISDFKANQQTFDNDFKMLYHIGQYTLYKL